MRTLLLATIALAIGWLSRGMNDRRRDGFDSWYWTIGG
jgi:hypothetical protein